MTPPSRGHRLRRRHLLAAGGVAGATAALLARPALAFPDRPLRWIVAYPAGGGTDALARVLGQAMAERLGQPVVVDNRPGAGATLGADAAAKALPDGHTVFSGDSGNMVNAIALFRRLPYDPARDFRAVGQFAEFPLVVAVPAASRFRTIADYVAAAKAAPGAMAIGTPGVGSPHHLAVERFMREAGVRLNVVPYRGGAPAVNDMLAGSLESTMLDVASGAGQLRGGQLRALAATSPERWRNLPDVPTLRESGLPDYEAPAWQALVLPAATPDDRVRRLAAALEEAMAQPAIRARLVEIGVEPVFRGPADTDAMMASQRGVWVPFIRELGITLDG